MATQTSSHCYEPFRTVGHVCAPDIPLAVTLGSTPDQHRIYASTGHSFRTYNVGSACVCVCVCVNASHLSIYLYMYICINMLT